MISLNDIENKTTPVVINNFLSDLHCDSILRSTKTDPGQGGLAYALMNIVDDMNGTLKGQGRISIVEDENTQYGTSLVSYLPLPNPIICHLSATSADHYGEHVRPAAGLISVFLKDSSFGEDKYHPPRILDKSGSLKTLTLFVNDTEGEVLVFDKTYVGATPKTVEVEHRYKCEKGTAIITSGNRYISTVPSRSDNMVLLQMHFVLASDALGQGAEVWSSL